MSKKQKRGSSQDTDQRQRPSQPAKAADGEPKRKDRRPFDTVRENLEAFLVAVILAIVIRHFSVEAFEIPTGSMATTLYGLHAWIECPNCGTSYAVALQSDSSTGKIVVPYSPMLVCDEQCPNEDCTLDLHSRGLQGRPLGAPEAKVVCGSCGKDFSADSGKYRQTRATDTRSGRCPLCHHVVRNLVIEEDNRYGGDKILVTKFAYTFGRPERWDVIVFEFDQWKNYIKRLVGLPGELIEVWDGDVYVNGKIERKSKRPRAQQSLWTRISDSDVGERGLNGTAWQETPPLERKEVPVPKNAAWDRTTKRWSVNALNDVTVLRYLRRFDNFYSYNLLLDHSGIKGFPPDVQVGDKKVAFSAKVVARGQTPPGASPQNDRSKDSWVGAEIRDGDFTFQLRIPVGSPSEQKPAVLARLETDPGPAPSPNRPAHPSGLQATRPIALPVGVSTRIEMENLDDRVAVRVNGEEVLALEYTSFPEGASLKNPPRPPSTAPDANDVHLIASNVQAELESIQVYRDMYYISRSYSDTWSGIRLGEGEYFVMGDNAPSSSDGRYWGCVPEENLMGKALLVFWPAWPLNFQMKFIR